TVPIHTASYGILCAPTFELLKKLSAESFVFGKDISSPQSDEMPESIQLPNDARVGTIVANQIDFGVIIKRPLKSGQWISVPIDFVRAETFFAETQQRPTVLVHDAFGLR